MIPMGDNLNHHYKYIDNDTIVLKLHVGYDESIKDCGYFTQTKMSYDYTDIYLKH